MDSEPQLQSLRFSGRCSSTAIFCTSDQHWFFLQSQVCCVANYFGVSWFGINRVVIMFKGSRINMLPATNASESSMKPISKLWQWVAGECFYRNGCAHIRARLFICQTLLGGTVSMSMSSARCHISKFYNTEYTVISHAGMIKQEKGMLQYWDPRTICNVPF